MCAPTRFVLGSVLLALAISISLSAALAGPAGGPAPPRTVMVTDLGREDKAIGPGAPAHVIGLTGVNHGIDMNTGAMAYGLLYVAALDPKDPRGAVPGEGYIGMPKPNAFNWYWGGFFDLVLNGRSIGGTFPHSVTGRSSGARGYVDFVFDTPQAMVRIRFVAKAGGDCLYCQAKIEPKEAIRSAHLGLRCYPAGFITTGDRHMLSATRDLPQGTQGKLDAAKESWLLCYDKVFDWGVDVNGLRGGGPCAAIWLPEEVVDGSYLPGGYGAGIGLNLKPGVNDYRFVFFDFSGKTNAAAQAAIKARAPELAKELAAFDFADPVLRAWPVEQKWVEVQKALASAGDAEAKAKYERWHNGLPAMLKALGGGQGAIMAESEAARAVAEWEKGLPELLLKELLAGI